MSRHRTVALSIAVLAFAHSLAAAPTRNAPRSQQQRQFETVGIYLFDLPPKNERAGYCDFYKACGYNYVELCDWGFALRPDLLAAHYDEVADAIKAAQHKGFKVSILLLACLRQWQGPADKGDAGTFSPLDKKATQERLSCFRKTVRALRHADGFVFFAGDPGGNREGRSTISDCMDMARAVRKIVCEEAPRAQFAVNLWAVAEWSGYPSAFTLDFWQKQVLLSRAVAEEKDLLGPHCGVVFSLDNYYRLLALACYDACALAAGALPGGRARQDAARPRRRPDPGMAVFSG